VNRLDDIQREMARAVEAERSGNQGRVRASARRAAGIALAEFQRRFPERGYSGDFISQLRAFGRDPSVPDAQRDAAVRLQARLSPDFKSPSQDPIEDARVIISYVLERLG
jgi:hypothetical protein